VVSWHFGDLDINGHRETWPIRAKGFRRWLTRCFFEDTEGAPSSGGHRKRFAKPRDVGAERDRGQSAFRCTGTLRVGGLDGRLYPDIGDETWRAVEIDANGWCVIANTAQTASSFFAKPCIHGGFFC
jgi:hypothetical protein